LGHLGLYGLSTALYGPLSGLQGVSVGVGYQITHFVLIGPLSGRFWLWLIPELCGWRFEFEFLE